MSFTEKIANSLSLFSSDLASLIKVILKSKGSSPQQKIEKEKEIFLLGNGPSLRQTLDQYGSELHSKELMAVNFFANTPDFFHLQPNHYILADGHFFDGINSDPNVKRLWEQLNKADWPITLHVPASRLNQTKELYSGTVKTFNLTPIEGHKKLTHRLIKCGFGMPRPRNVMIPAVMISILAGYGKIYLLGADHSWSRTLSVDHKNRVISRQPHFYTDNEKELDRVAEEYKGYHLHDILNSLTIAFRSYHQIKEYGKQIGVEIINLTPDSMIDAFPRNDTGVILHK